MRHKEVGCGEVLASCRRDWAQSLTLPPPLHCCPCHCDCSHVARFVAFVSGSFAALLLALALVDERLLERDLMGRQLVWCVRTWNYAAACSDRGNASSRGTRLSGVPLILQAVWFFNVLPPCCHPMRICPHTLPPASHLPLPAPATPSLAPSAPQVGGHSGHGVGAEPSICHRERGGV